MPHETMVDKAEPAPWWMAAFLAPVLSVLIRLGFRLSATERAQRVGRWFFRNAPPQVTSAEQFAAARIIGVTLALFMIVVGNVMPRVRANWIAGLRTKRLLADPDLWRTTHRAFGAALVLSGLVTLIVAAIAPAFALLIGATIILVSCIVAFATTARAGASAGSMRI